MKITKDLERMDAYERAVLKRIFGDAEIVTRELVMKHSTDINWNWVADYLFDARAMGTFRDKCSDACLEFRANNAKARQEYLGAQIKSGDLSASADNFGEFRQKQQKNWERYMRKIAPIFADVALEAES